MNSEKISQLLVTAQTALTNQDKTTLDKTLYEILKTDIHIEEAWALLYAYYGNGKPYEQFKGFYIQNFFPEQMIQRDRPASDKIPTQPSKRRSQQPSPEVIPSPIRIPEPLPVPSPLAPIPEPAGQDPALFSCNYCGLPYSSREEVLRHITLWHPTPSAHPIQPEQPHTPVAQPTQPERPYTPEAQPMAAPEGDEIDYSPKKTPWGWIFFFIGAIAAIVIAVVAFWPYIQAVFTILILIFFFPVIFPLALMLAGAVLSIFGSSGSWMIKFALYLLAMKWWWCPVGWIVGCLFFWCKLTGGLSY